MNAEPDEVITIAHCRGCKQITMPAALVENHEVASDQLACPRCGTKMNADSFYDYADIRTVDYE